MSSAPPTPTLTTKCANRTSVACVVTGDKEVDAPYTPGSSFYVPDDVEYIEYFPAAPTKIYAEGLSSKIKSINKNLKTDSSKTALAVTALSFRYDKLTEAVNLVQWPDSLTDLDLTGNNIVQLNASFTSPPYLQSFSSNQMKYFDGVKLPPSLQSINLDFNSFDTFNIDNDTYTALLGASVLTDVLIRPKACAGTLQTLTGTPFTYKGKPPGPTLTHKVCVLASSTTPGVPSTASPRGGVLSLMSIHFSTPKVDNNGTPAPASGSTSSSSSTGVIIGAVCGGVVVVAALLFFFCRRTRRSKAEDHVTILGATQSDDIHHHPYSDHVQPYPRTDRKGSANSTNPLPLSSSSFASYTHPRAASSASMTESSMFAYAYDIRGDGDLINYRIPKREIQNRQVCGKGGFATVYRATFDDQVVAVKELTHAATRGPNQRHIQAFMNEIKLFSTLQHANIVTFVGVTWTTLNDLALVTEFMAGGDLRDFLVDDETPQHLGWFNSKDVGRATKLSLAINVADAVTYLHSFSPSILHRDLKSRNVLLTADLVAKLTDFGISREVTDETMTAEAGTAAWTAPEVLTNHGHYDESADVYSLGVVLSELDTWQIPYSNNSTTGSSGSSGNMSNVQMAMLVAQGKLRPAFRPDCPPQVLQIAMACLDMNPEKRPKASKVAYDLRRLEREMK
ncbi:Aste57867_14291 [Aphanomyces stellatus]|uniref:Aste57867_14291 protein n=1 Tax=Aphanomyces stellatus TaxID=120398 RepID=A0A485L0V1_9STRA|nr:hypothetical protein As57867_014239 [Aphanomyces stellatus]VFT91116.1 Aste57867_14291 [Aphanomyces stellatus]